MNRVGIIDSGVANLASIQSAFAALGAATTIARTPAELETATHIVLPGVGAFGPAIASLRDRGFDEVLRQAAAEDRPLLGVCLGMQLLGEGSEEALGEAGISVFPGWFTRLPDGQPVPHLGWNGVEVLRPDPILATGTAAFANSYALPKAPEGWAAGWSMHGRPFVSALRRGRTLLCQFHPELSGPFGLGLLDRWLEGSSSITTGEADPARELTVRIIPCLDVKDGQVVKGVRFQNLRHAGDPARRAELYETEGADEIVLLDVGAAPEKRDTQVETVRAVRRKLHIPFTVGGGVRTVEDARHLLSAGADKVSVNTAAVRNPALLEELAAAFGSQCTVLAIDARRKDRSWETLVVGGRDATTRDAVEWAAEGVARGAGEILLTSWDRDGTRDGCDLELLRKVSTAVDVPVIASGGIGSRRHVFDAHRAGASAVLAASVFHDGEDTPNGIKSYLAEKGAPVRR